MRIVVALGGNALLRRGDRPDASVQIGRVQAAARAIAPLAAVHEVLICHGNGPQVGMLALESQTDPTLTNAFPLDALVAQTQGLIGYWLAQALRNAGVVKPVVCLVTQTVVRGQDPAFAKPTKFIGPGYPEPKATDLATRYGWNVLPDGELWRRVVPSPEPVRLLEHDTVSSLLGSGSVVIAGGGGGAVVIEQDDALTGVEAVVDKDLLAALLAIRLHSDRLIILTDVPALMRDFGTPQASPIGHLSVDDLAGMTFPAGSMGPKVEACRRFAETGHPATIGAIEDLARLVTGNAGTTIARGPTADATTTGSHA